MNEPNVNIVNLVAELAMEADKSGELIDFGMLNINESEAFHLMSSNVVEGYYDVFDGNIAALATVTALVVENFVLSLMLSQK